MMHCKRNSLLRGTYATSVCVCDGAISEVAASGELRSRTVDSGHVSLGGQMRRSIGSLKGLFRREAAGCVRAK